MTKAELSKLHSVLSKLNKKVDALTKKVDGLAVDNKIMGNMVNQLDIDVRNLFHVTAETQEQLRNSSGTKVVSIKDAPRTRPSKRD